MSNKGKSKPIEWIVLEERKDGNVLAMACKIIRRTSYNEVGGSGPFERDEALED